MSAMRPITCTVTNAADGLSNAVDLEELDFAGVIIPAAWTAAGLSFLTSPTSTGTYGSCYDDANAEITIASAGVVAGRTILFTDALRTKLRAIRFLKIRSGAAGAAVQQGAARTLTILASE